MIWEFLVPSMRISSADSLDILEEPAPMPYKDIFDNSKMALVRHFLDGRPPQVATMVPGPVVFAMRGF